MPWKLLHRADSITNDGKIRPLHFRVNINSRCNANCSFCVVRDRDVDLELESEELLELAERFHSLGAVAATICADGEPTIHPGLDAFLDRCQELDIKTGIVTNALIWSDALKIIHAAKRLTWVRMSVVDVESGNYDSERLRRLALNMPEVAVSVSFTVTRRASRKTAMELIAIAEETPNCIHLKFVEDALQGAPDMMDELEREILTRSDKALFQKWERGVHGASECLVSKLKPVIHVDGYVYPCCHVAGEGGYGAKYRMTHWRDFNLDTPGFDGAICASCYWSKYNEVLSGLVKPLEHKEFV